MPWSNDSNMASYAFLMQTRDYETPDYVQFIMVRMTLIGIGLSVVGGLLSVFLTCYVPVRSDALFSVCNMCVALIGAQLAFAGAENAFPKKIMCKISTASLQFLFSAVHFWSLAFSVHLVMKLFRFLHGKRSKRRFLLVMVGWIAPILVVATTAVLAGDGYGDQKLCWLSVSNGSQWAFVGPVIFITSTNAVVLLAVLVVQYKHDKRKKLDGVTRTKNLCLTLWTQIPMSNLTWLLGLAPPWYFGVQYLFVMINASQGMLIFGCHMLCSAQTRSLLKSRFHNGPEANKGQDLDSKSGSTGNTQSLEMEVVGDRLKTISFSKKTENES